MSGARILVVDDEPAIRRALLVNLSRRGFHVTTSSSGEEALAAAKRRPPDLVLLDLGLPDLDGIELIRQFRARSAVPIIVLSVRGDERMKVDALDVGADDYLTKPFGVEELLARVRAVLRRAYAPGPGPDAVLRLGDLAVDFERRLVCVRGAEVKLTPTEYELLKLFIAHPNKVLTHQMLISSVWGPEYRDETHYLHVYVAQLRRKIEPDPTRPRYIITEPGVGYRFRTT